MCAKNSLTAQVEQVDKKMATFSFFGKNAQKQPTTKLMGGRVSEAKRSRTTKIMCLPNTA